MDRQHQIFHNVTTEVKIGVPAVEYTPKVVTESTKLRSPWRLVKPHQYQVIPLSAASWADTQ